MRQKIHKERKEKDLTDIRRGTFIFYLWILHVLFHILLFSEDLFCFASHKQSMMIFLHIELTLSSTL